MWKETDLMVSVPAGFRVFAALSLAWAVVLGGDIPAQAELAGDNSEQRTEPSTVSDTPPSPESPAPENVPRAPPKKRRGGINPCMTPDAGFGIYDGWSGAGISIGQVLLPHQGGVSKTGQFDAVIHFHGHEPVRKEFVKAAKGIVLVGINLGIGSGAYQSSFSSPERSSTFSPASRPP